MADDDENSVEVIEDEPPGKKSKETEQIDIKSPSPVWRFAKRLEGGKAQCNLCLKIYVTPKGNTSNIREHIKHSDKKEAKELKELSEKKAEAKAKKKENDEERKEKKSITNFFQVNKPVTESPEN
jgi:hypothetical protein